MDIYQLEDKMGDKKVRGWIFRKFLHTIALFYLDELEPQYKAFMIDILPELIPCWECQEEYKWYILNNPPDFSGRDEFLQRILDFHNARNVCKGSQEYTFDEMIEEMSKR